MKDDSLAQIVSALIGSATSLGLALIMRRDKDRPRRRRIQRLRRGRRQTDDFTDDPDAL